MRISFLVLKAFTLFSYEIATNPQKFILIIIKMSKVRHKWFAMFNVIIIHFGFEILSKT